MRMFNLKENAVKRIKDLGTQAPEQAEETAAEASGAEDGVNPIQSEKEQGIRIAWRTDVGRVRKNNQDAVIIGNGLAGVADGMGGHQGGEVASGGLRDGLLRETEGKTPGKECLRYAIETVNLELWEQQEKDASLTGMGTTLTVLWPAGREMLIGHVGDSRAYLLRDGELKQVTSDHSMVADMVRRGVLTEEQAACHPMRNFITRAVGTEDTVEADILSLPRCAGDRWLICSDGLHGLVSRQELKRMMQTENIEEAANEMLETALDNGGRDNISIVILQDTDGPADSSEPCDDEAEGELNG